MIENNVFERREADAGEMIVSANLYNFTIGAVLLWGFFINYLMVGSISPESIMAFGYWPFLIGYFVSCFAGIMIFTKSDNPVISFLGYNLVVVPFGLVVNMQVSRYSPTLVLDAVQITGMVTMVMMCAGSLFPKFFFKISGALFMSLIAVMIAELVGSIFFNMDQGIFDWIVVVIFCGYIGYDWARANAIPKTFDNAVDSAAAIYMDIIILFLRILSILGRRR